MNYKRKVKRSKLGISRSLQKHQLVIHVLLQTLFERTLLSQNFVYSSLLLTIKVDLFFSRCCYYLENAITIYGTKHNKLQYILALSPSPDPRDCQFLYNLCFQNWNPVHLSNQLSNWNRLIFIRSLNTILKNIPLTKYLWNQFEVSLN